MFGKRLLATALAAMTALSMTACGGGSSQSATTAAGKTDGKEEAKTVKLTIAHGSSETHPLHRAFLQFKDELEATGQFVVEIYPSQQFGSDEEMIQSVKTGDLMMCVSPSSYLPNDVPSTALIELPYVFPNVATARAVLEGEWGQKELSLMQDVGLYGLGFMESGMRQITNSKKEITLPTDLNGMKFRTMQVAAHVEFFNSLGASAEGSPFSELYTNLSTGVFDGQENPIAQIYANKFYEVQKYMTISEHVYTSYIPIMKLDTWNSFTEEQRELINKAYENAKKYEIEQMEADEAAQKEEMVKSGVTITVLTDEQKQAFIDAAQPTLQKYRESLGADVYDEFAEAVKAATVK